ncbi:MAG: hypothetical protein K6B43_03800 [Treponema sp.]|nr:hypothetical protein [Treponema sp.]
MNRTAKFLSLFIVSSLSVAAFLLEQKLCDLGGRSGVIWTFYSFFAIPALFAVWLFAFYRLRAKWWRILVFAASYALWFCLSWVGWLVLLDSEGWCTYRYFGWLFVFLYETFRQNYAYLEICYNIFNATITIVLYLLFIAENLALKKLFSLSFKKSAWLLLFLYPLSVAFCSLLAMIPIQLFNAVRNSFDWNYLELLFDIRSHFYFGTVIFGYMMTEGLIFILGKKKTKSEFTERFEKLSDDEKCACLIALCESILPKLADLGGAKFASDVLEKCRQWLESKNVEADYLYSLLESENDICVFQFLNDEKDSEKENVLQCLSTALAYIILLAYRFENQVYLPEPIECVDSETVEYLFCHFQKLCPNSDLLEKLLPSENKN